MRFLHFPPCDRTRAYRVSTPLELMFDLATVIAVAAAAAGLHHAIAEGHAVEGLPGFAMAFFMIWWSWMNYTWFASAYDDGSAAFRILTMAAMFGALTIAAGVPAVFAEQPIHLSLLGFVIMRVVMAIFWFGAAAGDPAHRKTARVYGAGILAMQVYWVALLLSLPPSAPAYTPLVVAGIIGELAVPAIAELRYGSTTWHRHHIIERYGLFTIIVLGECFFSIVALLATGDHGAPSGAHGFIAALSCAVVTFSMWAIYFTREEHLGSDDLRRALLWGYGHFVVFAATAATGAGFAVFHDVAVGKAEIGYRTASFAIAVPVATYLTALWAVRDRFHLSGAGLLILPAAVIAIMLAPLAIDEALLPIAIIMAATAALRNLSRPRIAE